jgi:exonuclease III
MSRRFGGDGARWDKGERNILTGLAEYDLPDVYRALNGYEVEDQSWLLRNRGREFPRRFDHVFASTWLTAVECGYLHDWQTAGMSDHAPIEVRFDL